MDEDGEADSLSELSPCSLSCWMMKNLSHEETAPNNRLSLSVPDTVLLQDGHLFHWLFTSSKSGNVMKRGTKRLEWDGLVKFLVRCSRTKDSRPPAEVIATARRLKEGRTYPVMLTAWDIRSLREKHNVHLLDEIVAIQPFVTKTPFTGCGFFETEFERKGRKRTSPATLATFELVRWPAEEVRWFDDFEPSCADSWRAGETKAQQRRRKGSAKRVHGVLHRGLATTTKKIVEHVEKETGEVILEVVAQFAFRPGSGQPTLIWLDSVRTVQPTQQQFGDHSPREIVDPNSAFLKLTRDLGEEKSGRSWTTFFPPKIGDLINGGESLGFAEEAGVSAESQRPEFFRSTAERSRKVHTEVRVQNNVNVEKSSHIPLADANEMPLDGIFCTAAGAVEQSCTTGISGEETVGRFRNSDRPSGGDQRRQNFTLPTESWAYRSAGRRGLYFSGGTGLGARDDQSLSEQWPRKRSTGTTMRRDCDRDRVDLRSAAENQRPWTAPSAQAAKRGGGLSESGRGSVGASGCYGDYCHYAGTWSSHQSKSGNRAATGSSAAEDDIDTEADRASEASRSVSYRSILKSRAEEKMLSTWSQPQSSLPCKSRTGSSLRKGGCGGESQTLPTLTGSGEEDLRLLRQVKRKGGLNFASLISERMRLLAASLIGRGGGQYFTLGSSDRATASRPEAAQRAIEELVYEQALSYLHPTTASRSVAVCGTCAMVYGYMDKFRRQTKEIRAASGKSTRAARIAVARQQRRQQQDRGRPHTAAPDGEGCPPLRRYSNLNLGVRPATSDGLNR